MESPFVFINIINDDSNVLIIGDFTNWKPVDITKNELECKLKNGINLYKYIVNGVSQCSNCELTIIGPDGNLYNYIILENDHISSIYDNQSIHINNPYSLCRLAQKCYNIQDYTGFINYNLKGIKMGSVECMYNLYKYYCEIDNINDAIKYCKMAINKHSGIAIYNLAHIYCKYQMWSELKKLCHDICYTMQIYDKLASGNVLHLLANYYYKYKKNITQSIFYYDCAIQLGSVFAMVDKAYLLRKQHNYKEMIICLKSASKCGYIHAMLILANYYRDIGNLAKAIKYWKMGAENNCQSSMYELYINSKNFDDIDYYLHLYMNYKENPSYINKYIANSSF